jgi:predicted RNase H-like nuclease
MTICIIGIDCATNTKKVGLARGYLDGDQLSIDRLTKPGSGQSVCDVVSEWIDLNIPTLLAVDAPLGWPDSLGQNLHEHTAGEVISVDPNLMFRRETDRFIKREINKQPLDVGADRIARTAHAALRYLADISIAVGQQIPLAWNAEQETILAAIEVYPAATLKQSGYQSDGYKKKENWAERREILVSLCRQIQFAVDTSAMVDDDDVLDAAVCVLAGCHFLKNQCMRPENIELARKEGWIWVTTGDEYE